MGTSSSKAASPSSIARARRSASSSRPSDVADSDREVPGVSIREEVELLQRIPLFANVEAAKLKLLAFTSDRIAFEAGQGASPQGRPPAAPPTPIQRGTAGQP